MLKDRTIPTDEAVETIRDALGFAGDHSAPHVVTSTEPIPGESTSFIAVLSVWSNFQTGKPQRFRITIEPEPDTIG